MMREPRSSVHTKSPKITSKRSKTPVMSRSRNLFANDATASPMRIGALNYSPYKRDYSKSGRSARRRRDDNTGGMMKYHLEKELQELIQKEKNMQSRLDVLEKEQKSLNSLVRKSERHINDAYKKAQDEENKIFSLFLDVIKEKNIKIDLTDLDDEEDLSKFGIKDENEAQNNQEKDTNVVLGNFLKSEVYDNNNDLSWPMLALQRRALMENLDKGKE